jgi:hypothetical protein
MYSPFFPLLNWSISFLFHHFKGDDETFNYIMDLRPFVKKSADLRWSQPVHSAVTGADPFMSLNAGRHLFSGALPRRETYHCLDAPRMPLALVDSVWSREFRLKGFAFSVSASPSKKSLSFLFEPRQIKKRFSKKRLDM